MGEREPLVPRRARFGKGRIALSSHGAGKAGVNIDTDGDGKADGDGSGAGKGGKP